MPSWLVPGLVDGQRGSPLPPRVNRPNDWVRQALEQPNTAVEQRPPEPHDQICRNHGDDETGEDVGQIVSANENAAQCDQRSDSYEETTDAAINKVNAKGDSESRAGVIAGK